MFTFVETCSFACDVTIFYIPIVPLPDGNGRIGRLWHTVILQNWKEFFAWLPVETMIHENQSSYYAAINTSNTAGESTIFVAFMLNMICEMLKEIVENQNAKNVVGINVGINARQMSVEERVLILLKDNPRMTAKQLASTLGLSERQIERTIAALKTVGRLERIGANRNGSWRVV